MDTDIATGTASLSSAVLALRRRVDDAAAREADEANLSSTSAGAEGASKRQVDVVRKLDLLQRLSDAASGAGTERDAGRLDIQDRVFHDMVLEPLPDFSTLGPSFMQSTRTTGSRGGKRTDVTAAAVGKLPAEGDKSASGAATTTTTTSTKKPEAPPEAPVGKKAASGGRRPGGKKAPSAMQAKMREIIIPLGPERMPHDELIASLRNEYAVRYCELLGVAPNAGNIAVVHTKMPLEECTVRQVIHPGLGRGERKNYISIIPPCYKNALHRQALHDAPAKADDPREGLPFESLASATKDGADAPGSPGVASAAAAAATGTTAVSVAAIAGVPRFEAYKHRFVHPFNLASRFEQDPDAPKTRSQRPTASAEKPPLSASMAASQSSTRGLGMGTRGSATTSLGGTLDASQAARSRQGGPRIDFASSYEQAESQTQRRMRNYDQIMKAAAQGNPKDPKTVQQLRGAVSDDRPVTVTAAHVAALSKMLGENQTAEGSDPDVAPHPPPNDDDDDGKTSVAPASVDRTHVSYGVSTYQRKQDDLAAQRELDAYVAPSDEGDVRTFQTQFTRDFPFAFYFTNTDAVAALKESMLDDDINGMICALLEFVFVAYVEPRASTTRRVVTPADKDEAFVKLYDRVMTFLYQQDMKQTGTAAPAALAPIALLMLRVSIESELHTHLPTLCRTPPGQQLLQRLDGLVTAVVDPLNLLCHIAAVDSSPHSIRLLQTKRRPGRVPPLLTSPLTRFILGEPQASAAKAMQRTVVPRLQRGLAELETHLTPMARSRLMKVMAERKFKV